MTFTGPVRLRFRLPRHVRTRRATLVLPAHLDRGCSLSTPRATLPLLLNDGADLVKDGQCDMPVW
jgi:hypothetical protein